MYEQLHYCFYIIGCIASHSDTEICV